jgi:NhaP-type Na+/H+ or K+/H+ antiporter
MGMLESVLQRLPLSPAMFYLPVGYLLGPAGAGLIGFDPARHAEVLTLVTEIALLISLFTVGLKMRVPLSDRLWLLPLRLGFVGMLASVGLLSAVGVLVLHLPLGAAVLLAAILSPTDPILASDVQLKDVGDRDRIRFTVSGEGGMNDGSAYPLVLLGLALLGIEEFRPWAEWTAIWRVLLALAVAIAVGWLCGRVVARLVIHLRRRHRSALGMEEFLTLGLIALSYGLSSALHGIGFVAVFVTGVAVRQTEAAMTGGNIPPEQVLEALPIGDGSQVETDPKKAPAYMTEMVLGFNQQLEHIAEFAMVLLVGVLVSEVGLSWEGVLLACLLFLLVRPLSVWLALLGSRRSPAQLALMSWFGIRGIGSLYYLSFALQYQWLTQHTNRFISMVVTVITLSIVVHGISSTPLMDRYYKRQTRRRARKVPQED